MKRMCDTGFFLNGRVVTKSFFFKSSQVPSQFFSSQVKSRVNFFQVKSSPKSIFFKSSLKSQVNFFKVNSSPKSYC